MEASSDSLREAMKTRAPFWIKAWAAISPRPVAPPVTRTMCEVKSKSVLTRRSSLEAACVILEVVWEGWVVVVEVGLGVVVKSTDWR